MPVTIREERDPAFWMGIASHPEVQSLLGNFSPEHMAALISLPTLTPLAAEHGGFLFVALDGAQRIQELHTLFTPAGWGREVHAAAKMAFNRMFAGDAQVIATYQMEHNPKSQPPRSFGFLPVGDFAPSPFGSARTWILTRDAWAASPGGRSSCH